MFEQQMHEIAKRYPSTRCVKLHYLEAQMDQAGVPAILAYRAGNKFAGLVPVIDEMDDEDDLDTEAVLRALRR